MHAYIHINDLAVSEKVPMKNRTYNTYVHINTCTYIYTSIQHSASISTGISLYLDME